MSYAPSPKQRKRNPDIHRYGDSQGFPNNVLVYTTLGKG
jgi:hypothetical protein